MNDASRRIALIVPSLRGGGAERVTLNLAEYFIEKGYAVDLICVSLEGALVSEIPSGVNSIDLGSKRVLSGLGRIRSYLREERPLALLSGIAHLNIVCLIARMAARSRVPIICCEHNTLSIASKQRNRFFKRMALLISVKLFYRFADSIVAVSKGVADDLVKSCGVSGRNMRIIYNPVITSTFCTQTQRLPSHPWAIEKKVPLVVASGRLQPHKDFETLLKAIKLVINERNVKLLILGEGPERPKLELMIHQLGLSDSVQLAGFIRNPYSVMACADLFVLSSRCEGLPTVMIEALALGLNIVSTDCESGPREILDHGRFGRLVPVGDAGAIASGILYCLKNPMSSELLTARGCSFSQDEAGRQYENIIVEASNKPTYNPRVHSG